MILVILMAFVVNLLCFTKRVCQYAVHFYSKHLISDVGAGDAAGKFFGRIWLELGEIWAKVIKLMQFL